MNYNLHTIVEQTVVNLEQLREGTYNLGDRLLLLKNTTENRKRKTIKKKCCVDFCFCLKQVFFVNLACNFLAFGMSVK